VDAELPPSQAVAMALTDAFGGFHWHSRAFISSGVSLRSARTALWLPRDAIFFARKSVSAPYSFEMQKILRL